MSRGKKDLKELNSVQIEFLKMMAAFMHGSDDYHLPEDFTQIMDLYELSKVHNVSAVVYNIMRREKVLDSPEYLQLRQFWKNYTQKSVMLQVQRTEGFLILYRKLTEAGLKPLVVKGIVCRNLYSEGDYRISGDEDMLARKEEFPLYDEILQAEGYVREEVDLKHLLDEIPYLNKQNGVCIELHFALFSEESGAYGHLNSEFSGVFRNCICERIQNVAIWTMEPTLHLFYLICHGLKHFLHSGFGIRQLCDMVMMAEYYGDQINWNYINGRLQALHMDVFWYNLAAIGMDYLGMSTDKAAYPSNMSKIQVDYLDLLLDLLDSGVFGDSSMERKHSANITLAAAKSGRKNMKASLSASLFPDSNYMKKNYPWLVRYPVLLPVAWIMRIFQYLLNRKQDTGSESQSSITIGMDRVELLREYHIID